MAFLKAVMASCLSLAAVAQQKDITVILPPNRTTPQVAVIPRPIRVGNEAKVKLTVQNLSPLEACRLGDRKSTELEPKNALEEMLKIVTGIGVFSIGSGFKPPADLSPAMMIKPPSSGMRATGSEPPPEKNLLFEEITKRVNRLTGAEGRLVKISQRQEVIENTVKTAVTGINEILNKDYRGEKWSGFSKDRDAALVLSNAAQRLSNVKSAESFDELKGEMEAIKILMSTFHKLYDTQIQRSQENITQVADLDARIAQAEATAKRLLENEQPLKEQLTKLSAAAAILAKIETPVPANPNDRFLSQSFSLPADRNVKVTGTINCFSLVEPTKPTVDQTPYAVTYQNIPRLTLSLGLLFTTLDKRQMGTGLVRTGADANGVSTFKNTIAITDQAGAQVVPFSFLNYRLGAWDTSWKLVTFNLSGGVGVNANSGTKEPEFFSGVSFGFDRMLAHTGMHLGRVQRLGGGFSVGDVVPNPFTPPIYRSYEKSFAMGLSFRIVP